jgi:hypothetical protein
MLSSDVWLPRVSACLSVRTRAELVIDTSPPVTMTRPSAVCYDKEQRYMIISVRGVYAQYCELPAGAFGNLMGAPSMGQFFNRNIRGSGPGDPYDCLNHRLPTY